MYDRLMYAHKSGLLRNPPEVSEVEIYDGKVKYITYTFPNGDQICIRNAAQVCLLALSDPSSFEDLRTEPEYAKVFGWTN
jgi:hypothetical protein